jgi:hypothetical protein
MGTNMKVLKNKTTDLNGDGGKMTYADLIEMVFNAPVPGGCPPPDMRKDMRVLDVIEKGGDEFCFEDEDAKRLQGIVEGFRFGIRRRDFVAFADDVRDMPDKA